MRVYMEDGEPVCGSLNSLVKTTAAGFAQTSYLMLDMPEDPLAVLNDEETELARDSLFGGRTDICNHIVEMTDAQMRDGSKLCYIDFTSFYPTVQWDCEMQIGTPKLYAKVVNVDVNNWFTDKVGFATIDCTVPNDILYPVLPKRREGRLNFTCDDVVEEFIRLLKS